MRLARIHSVSSGSISSTPIKCSAAVNTSIGSRCVFII
ncbi:unnamed protein product [Schistosoma mattheei]|uniref:Uncharacterized protein n=1 Tax=Schistosoma mattheei TaxID=31246 RepID=A0A183PR64_9TREM|nr:unnamed protein product [Schistosoma mattheei]